MKMKKIVTGLAFAVLLAASVAVAPLSVMSISTYAEETSEESNGSGPEHAYNSDTESSDSEPEHAYNSDTESSDSEASSPEASSPEASSPEASSPEASSPEASSPETSSPEASSPEASSPESEIPSSGKNSDGSVTYEVVTGDEVIINNSPKYGIDSFIDDAGSTYAFIDSDKTTWRIFVKVSEEELKNYKSAYVYIKDRIKGDSSKIVKLTTNKAYKRLNSTIEAGEGYYFIVFVIEGVTGYVDGGSGNKYSDLKWTSIEFE